MMGRLINADKVISAYKKLPNIPKVEKDMLYSILEDIPTAYDVDKVVEQLKECSFYSEPTYDDDGYSNDDEIEVVNLWDAIEIVEKEVKE